jgi:hypothetical protein
MSKKRMISLKGEQREKLIQAMAKFILRKKKEQEQIKNLRKL